MKKIFKRQKKPLDKIEKDAKADPPRKNLPPPTIIPPSEMYKSLKINRIPASASCERELELSHSMNTVDLNAVPTQRQEIIPEDQVIANNNPINEDANARNGQGVDNNSVNFDSSTAKKQQGQNVYINQCQNFQIGQTINISGGSSFSLMPTKSASKTHNEIDILESNLERITNKQMWTIAHNVNVRWKNFALELGLEPDELEKIITANKENTAVTVFEALKLFTRKYPDTSLGFIVSQLRLSGQHGAIRKLVEQNKTVGK